MIELFYPQDGARLSLLTDVQKEFMEREFAGMHILLNSEYFGWGIEEMYIGEITLRWIKEKYGKGFKDNYANNPDQINLTKPRYIEFAWKSDVDCKLVLSRAKDFGEPEVKYPGDPEAGEIIYPGDVEYIRIAQAGNLFARTKYYWKVVSLDGKYESEVRSFETKDEFPRAIFAEGTANIRDLGGLPLAKGGHIRQGCIYRGAALENIVCEGYSLTQRGKDALHDIVKIKSDVDFRFSAIGVLDKSPIGDDVSYNILPARGYEAFFEDQYIPCWKPLIDFIADENNYPIYLHCSAGADRTGTFCQVIEALLGVEFKYIVADHTITSLTIRDPRAVSEEWAELGRFLHGYTEDCDVVQLLSTNIEKFLVERCGVSPETIKRLKKNLIEN